MGLDDSRLYRALTAKDARFDGLFFVGVRTTGIYCRPVCRARTPGRDRCLFFRTAAEAERAGFRACFRCRPELAPGASREEARPRLVTRAMMRIEAGALNEASFESLAQDLGVSSRHLRRVMGDELGLTPVELAQSRRLAFAKHLVTDTFLPMTEIAFASGYKSLRRFNDAFRTSMGRPPTALRRSPRSHVDEEVLVTLDYRPPYDWEGMLAFLRPRAISGIERVEGDAFSRTVRIGHHTGWFVVRPKPGRSALDVSVSLSLTRVLMPLVARVRRMFDLDAEPEIIARHLRRDPRLRLAIRRRPGLRVPGAVEPFEAAARAVLGQQVSVLAATTLAARLADAFGESVETSRPGLCRTFPSAETLSQVPTSRLASLGIVTSRAATLRALAQEFAQRAWGVDHAGLAEDVVEQLKQLPGVGEWTAQMIAMRALGWPDAFPLGDLGLTKALGGARPKQARLAADSWRPWRAYAVMHLWSGLP